MGYMPTFDQPIRAVVFDLDGTLYEDKRHFDFYMDALARRVADRFGPAASRAALAAYRGGIDGVHPLRPGRAYDALADLVLALDGNRVVRAWRFDGDELPPREVGRRYPGPVDPDQVDLISVGDLWWIPLCVARHFGLDRDAVREAFLETREFLAAPDTTLVPVPGLAELLRRLRGRVVLALATNSPQPDSEAILTKLELFELLEPKSYLSRKPHGLPAVLEAAAGAAGVGLGQVLSVGDNLRNDIVPARALGCRTLFIDPHGLAGPEDADAVVPGPAAMVAVLIDWLVR